MPFYREGHSQILVSGACVGAVADVGVGAGAGAGVGVGASVSVSVGVMLQKCNTKY